MGTPSNIHGTAISYRCAKFGAFVNSVTILTLRDLTITTWHSDSAQLLVARDVTTAVLVVQNKSISLLWELNFIFM